MDVTQAVNNLNSDYVYKVTNAMNQGTQEKTSETNSGDAFSAVYSSVTSLLESTNDYIKQAQQAEVDFALGNLTNTHELGVYQQQANIALQYTVAIRDKALEAYNAIMNMQI
ncbi:flagellar hook-basal body complex protein FliE [Lachnospira multipara]|jgi:flagellar hook-basal body complex protein FliE|uniref:flagellar hook-basal body complex protein FliE n=1 Tax=Lachnospira multipara TaxID=28051 RepID=UPI00040FAAD6|nr:flagellar hook-basal body complex protein FliE [Lachnospira multipara]